jgi:cell division topological specificity factor
MYGIAVHTSTWISISKSLVGDKSGGGLSYLPQLQRDLLKVIRKYVAVDKDAVSVSVESDGAHEILGLNIVLPN